MKVAACLVLLAACQPDLDQRTFLVDEPRVLAVIAQPAEAAPGATVVLTAIIAVPGAATPPTLSWSACAAPKPPTEDNPVAAACVGELAEDARGTSAAMHVPTDACQVFGPEPRLDGGRPRDADLTGGYYQPFRVRQVDGPLADDDQGRDAFALPRLACNLAGAPTDVALDFRDRYVRNANPPAPIVTRTDGVPLDTPIVAGATLALRVTRDETAAEPYVALDPATVTLVTRREGLRATWYADAGTLALDAAGTSDALDAGAAPTPTLDNTFTAPTTPGLVHLWIVLRDSRGGAAVTTTTLDVQ